MVFSKTNRHSWMIKKHVSNRIVAMILLPLLISQSAFSLPSSLLTSPTFSNTMHAPCVFPAQALSASLRTARERFLYPRGAPEMCRLLDPTALSGAVLSIPHVGLPDWSLETDAPEVKGKTIVEVTMEMAMSDGMFKIFERAGLSTEEIRSIAMSNSTGGIGPLLKERIIEQAQKGADVVGVSLLYENVWVQEVHPAGGSALFDTGDIDFVRLRETVKSHPNALSALVFKSLNKSEGDVASVSDHDLLHAFNSLMTSDFEGAHAVTKAARQSISLDELPSGTRRLLRELEKKDLNRESVYPNELQELNRELIQTIFRTETRDRPYEMRQQKVPVGPLIRASLDSVTHFKVKMYDGSDADVRVFRAPAGSFGPAAVYYLDCPEIADVVYPGKRDHPGSDEQARHAQSWLLGRATLTLLKSVEKKKPALIIMSEVPSIFVHHRMFVDEHTADPFFNDTLYVFNDHTPLEYAHPFWNEHNLNRLQIDPRYHRNMPFRHGRMGEWVVDGTAMIINAADAVYGVAEKHADVMRAMPLLKQFSNKINFITNGVSQRYWPKNAFKDPKRVAMMSDADLLNEKIKSRNDFVQRVAARQGLGSAWADEIIFGHYPIGVWTRRVVGYKRLECFADILLNPLMRQEFLDSGIVFIVGGRIHQDDPYGIEQFSRIQHAMQEDPRLRERVVFFDNYNIYEAPSLFQGADFSVMLADDGREASATGFQKAQQNGALIIASHDGAVPESVVDFTGPASLLEGANGFIVPYSDGRPTAEGLLQGFKQFRQVYDNPALRAAMVRNALGQSRRVSVERTAEDMLEFFNEILKKARLRREAVQAGEDQAEEILLQIPITPEVARQSLDILHHAPSFAWAYKEGGVTPTVLHVNEPGLRAFVDHFDYMRSLGSVGEWSLQFHAHNSEDGDLFTYVLDQLRQTPVLDPFRDAIETIAHHMPGSTDEEKIQLELKLLGITKQLLNHLDRLSRLERVVDLADPSGAHPIGEPDFTVAEQNELRSYALSHGAHPITADEAEDLSYRLREILGDGALRQGPLSHLLPYVNRLRNILMTWNSDNRLKVDRTSVRMQLYVIPAHITTRASSTGRTAHSFTMREGFTKQSSTTPRLSIFITENDLAGFLHEGLEQIAFAQESASAPAIPKKQRHGKAFASEALAEADAYTLAMHEGRIVAFQVPARAIDHLLALATDPLRLKAFIDNYETVLNEIRGTFSEEWDALYFSALAHHLHKEAVTIWSFLPTSKKSGLALEAVPPHALRQAA